MRKYAVTLLIGMGVSGFAFAQNDTTSTPAATQEKTEVAANTPAETTGSFPTMTTECKAGEAYRKVWIEYGSTGGQDCKVNYIRDQEQAKVLWTAQNDPNFCVDKAKSLINGTLAAFTCTEVQ